VEAVNALSPISEPIFVKEQLFLKVLVEGEATLYSYRDGKLRRYFYNNRPIETQQLIYKSYKIDEFSIAKNTQYKQQLWENVRCAVEKYSEVNKVEYKKSDLVEYFVSYNECRNVSYVNYELNKNYNGTFNIALRPGINNSSLEYEFINSSLLDGKFDNKWAFRFGLEFEYVKVNYTSIEVPIGMRHYMYLNENSKLFLNAQVVLDFPGSSKLHYAQDRDLDLSSKPNLAFGLGYKYNDKYSIEVRGHTNRNVLDGFTNWGSAYKTMSIIIGYSIL